MTRALVLGGGGITGIAWEVGVLQGLAESGFDIQRWDLVVGTSAGAIVGARLMGARDIESWFATQLLEDTTAEDEIVVTLAGRLGARCIFAGRRRRLRWLPGVWLTATTMEALVRRAARRRALGPQTSLDAPGPRRVLGPDPALARAAVLGLVARTAPEARYVEVIANALDPVRDWPAGLVVTAIALDGSTVAFDASTGTDLVRAVAASTAVPLLFPPIHVAGRPYVDGGLGSQTHAYLAAEMDEILVLAPINGGALAPELEGLRSSRRRVAVIQPSEAAWRALGRNLGLLDPARRSLAARAGRDDGLRAARELAPKSSADASSSAA